jgi:hypothetical protein
VHIQGCRVTKLGLPNTLTLVDQMLKSAFRRTMDADRCSVQHPKIPNRNDTFGRRRMELGIRELIAYCLLGYGHMCIGMCIQAYVCVCEHSVGSDSLSFRLPIAVTHNSTTNESVLSMNPSTTLEQPATTRQRGGEEWTTVPRDSNTDTQLPYPTSACSHHQRQRR